MSRSSLLILLGVLTMFAPFAGLPSSWVSILDIFFGLFVAVIGFSVRVQKVQEAMAQDPVAESTPAEEPTTPVPHGVSPI